MLLKGVQRLDEAAVGEAREASYSKVDADLGSGGMNGFSNFKFSLNAGKPLLSTPGYGHVLCLTGQRPGIAVPHPADLGEVDSGVTFLDFETLREAEGVGALPLLLRLRAFRAFREEVFEATVEI
jgi:hypothetical protein